MPFGSLMLALGSSDASQDPAWMLGRLCQWANDGV